MRVTILRGISGSGKTTWANAYANQALIVSTDHFFLQEGVYQFDPLKLAEYHERCFREFLEGILAHAEWIIVDNTNISAWEYAPYVLAGRAYGYEVELRTFECPVDVSRMRKQLVPENELQGTFERLERETRMMPKRFRSIHRVIPCTPRSSSTPMVQDDAKQG